MGPLKQTFSREKNVCYLNTSSQRPRSHVKAPSYLMTVDQVIRLQTLQNKHGEQGLRASPRGTPKTRRQGNNAKGAKKQVKNKSLRCEAVCQTVTSNSFPEVFGKEESGLSCKIRAINRNTLSLERVAVTRSRLRVV